MINYFNFKKFNDQYLITNDLGRYMFLEQSEFRNLVLHKTDYSSEIGFAIKENFFGDSSSSELFLEKIIPHYRNGKHYLFFGTSLHIFVITNECNMKCCYCQAQCENSQIRGKMTEDIAKKSADVLLSSPQKSISVEFQGGEPLMNFDIIKFIVEYLQKNSHEKNIDFSIVTNLTLLTDEMIYFIKQNNISISTSLDGGEKLHNTNRPYKSSNGTFNKVIDSINKLNNAGINVGAIQTTTKYSLNEWKSIIDTYIELGLNNIFIRPLSPLGYAESSWESIGYSTDEFILFYRNCLNYIIKKAKDGVKIRENYAGILLSKILGGFGTNYMELRSPCGAATGQLAYYYNGDVFTCDEGRMLYEMGNDSFKLGNVYNNTYDDLLNSPICKATCIASSVESLPICCDCVYQPYCGTCPVVNLATDGDIFPRGISNYRCRINKGILDILFSYIQKNDIEVIKIFREWAQ